MPTFSLGCPLEPWIERGGRILKTLPQVAGYRSLVAEMDGRQAFFKQARNRSAAAGLARVVAIYQDLKHPALPPLWGYWGASDGPLLVFECLEAERLRDNPRFLALPLEERRRALDTAFDLHLALASRGLVSSGFDPDSWFYDFAARRLWVMDLEEYRPGPFRHWRQARASAWAAPEEARRGARLDERTTVFHLGQAARLLLDETSSPVARATRPERRQRYPRVSHFVLAWRQLFSLPAVNRI